MNNLVVLFLIVHVIGDYYMQNESIANTKNEHLSKLLLHGCLYTLVTLPIMLWFRSYNLSLTLLIISGSHILIDMMKFFLSKGIKGSKNIRMQQWLLKEEKRGSIYIVDQLLHISAILIVAYVYLSSNYYIEKSIVSFMGKGELEKYLRGGLMLLLILKPVNITFRKLFIHTKPEDDTFGQNKKAGQMIGNLERMLVMALMMLGQYTAIGLVFTAKSISRYNKISENQAFAEYYLLGTLFSMLATVVIYMAVI